MKLKSKSNRDVHIVTSWDDFRDEDEKLIGLLEQYEIPATLYIPVNEIIEPRKLELARKAAERFEIGSHTVNHPILTSIDIEQASKEINDSKSILEQEIGTKVTSFCYPRGRYDVNTVKMLIMAGYKNARTTIVGNTKYPDDPFRIKTTAHVYQRDEYDTQTWLEYTLNKFDQVMEYGGYFHLWGHSYEVERDSEWGNLEWFFNYMRTQINANISS